MVILINHDPVLLALLPIRTHDLRNGAMPDLLGNSLHCFGVTLTHDFTRDWGLVLHFPFPSIADRAAYAQRDGGSDMAKQLLQGVKCSGR